MTLDELKAKYDKETIDTIEKLCDGSEIKAMQEQEVKLGALFYLKKTRRFKENSEYKTCSFWTYLKARHKWTEATFYNLRWAHITYPEETMKYGSDTLISIKTKCGSQKVPIVLKEIKTLQSKRKTHVDRFQKQEIIDKYKVEKPKKIDDKPTFKDWERECTTLRQANIDVRKELSERNEQVRKLKITLSKRDEKIAQLEAKIKELETFEDFYSAIVPFLPDKRSVKSGIGANA